MEKPRPIWEDLPRHLKIYVAEHLGDKSRQSLGQCSKMDHNIVENIPFTLKSVAFGSILLGNAELPGAIFTTHKYSNQMIDVSFQRVIKSFINIIKHPKSIIEMVTFDLENFETGFYPELVAELKLRNLKIRAKKMKINSIDFKTMELNDDHLELLALLDPKLLEVIQIYMVIKDSFLTKLVKTEQWKCVKGATLLVDQCENVRVEDFFHLEQLNLRGFTKLDGVNKMKLIENFQKRNPPIGSFFFVTNYQGLCPIEYKEKETGKDFEMKSSGKTLHVKENPGSIEAIVMSKTDEDCVEINNLLHKLQFFLINLS